VRLRVARLARHLTVGAVSVAIVAAAVLYAASPAVETIAARVLSVRSVPAGHESIQGQALEDGKPAHDTSVAVYRVVDGHKVLVGFERVNRQGRFYFRVRPAKYVVVVRHQHETARVSFRLAPRKTVFIAVTEKHHGGFVGPPVIFNY
jgi:hypothetical protein